LITVGISVLKLDCRDLVHNHQDTQSYQILWDQVALGLDWLLHHLSHCCLKMKVMNGCLILNLK